METTKTEGELFCFMLTLQFQYIHTPTYISPSYVQIYFSRLGCVIMCSYMRNVANVVVLSFISIKYCQIVQCTPHTVCVALSTLCSL